MSHLVRIDENKLFAFPAETEKQIISTCHKDVLCTHPEMFLIRVAMRRWILLHV